MIKPTIIVTGATGKTGSVVTTQLLKAGYPVRALVHREEARSARLQASGAELAVAELIRQEANPQCRDRDRPWHFCSPTVTIRDSRFIQLPSFSQHGEIAPACGCPLPAFDAFLLTIRRSTVVTTKKGQGHASTSCRADPNDRVACAVARSGDPGLRR
jgi:NAD(P)-dependent dehydrogenase (short-subunit alcohol dehydrogenase family)